MKVLPLASQESAQQDGYNWLIILTADDLTTTATNTAQTFTTTGTIQLAIGDSVRAITMYLKTPFQNTADNAFNSDTISIGDSGSATQFTSAIEMNANGSYVTETTSAGTAAKIYTAADYIKITVNSMSGKALNSINKGELQIFVKLFRPQKLVAASSSQIITTK